MSVSQLSEFFSNLSDRGLTVREHFTCCGSCGSAKIRNLKEKSHIGYCFYHVQCTEGASESGELYLHWGSHSPEDMDDLIVANAIVDEARACKLDVEWNGFSNKTVKLSNLDKSYFLQKLKDDEE